MPNPENVSRERLLRRVVLALLALGVAAGITVFLLHRSQPSPHPLDLVLPPSLAAGLALLWVWLWRRPLAMLRVIWIAFALCMAGIALPAWVLTWEAWADPSTSLVATLPPIGAMLLPLLLGMIVFVRPRELTRAALLAWLMVAGPVLHYLAFHPAELTSPRGLDLVMLLGPAMAMLLLYIPFHRGMEQWMAGVEAERTRMQELALRDPLTGLYNRRAGETFVASHLARPEASDALILFDIDRFKSINDTFGHPAGDEVLRMVAGRCAAILRRDDVFARWGGEEFLVLVKGPGEAGVARIAEDLRAAIAAAPIGAAGTVTASFGVAYFQPRDTIASWVKRADEALYRAKESGRNRVVGA